MAKSLEQQKAELEAKLARLKTKERARATRELIVLGAVCRKRMLANPANAKAMLDWIRTDVTREPDKEVIAGLVEVAKQIIAPPAAPSAQPPQQRAHGARQNPPGATSVGG